MSLCRINGFLRIEGPIFRDLSLASIDTFNCDTDNRSFMNGVGVVVLLVVVLSVVTIGFLEDFLVVVILLVVVVIFTVVTLVVVVGGTDVCNLFFDGGGCDVLVVFMTLGLLNIGGDREPWEQSPGYWREQEVPDGHLEQAVPCSYIWPLMKLPLGP